MDQAKLVDFQKLGGNKMRKVMYITAKTREKLIPQINEMLRNNPTAQIVGIAGRGQTFTAFIQYEDKD